MRHWLSIVCSLIVLIAISGCGPTQVVEDEECLKAVDALWTAVTSKRSDLLNQTDRELGRLKQSGQLSTSGHAELREVIETADAGRWTDAAQQLKSFMLGQRRSRDG